ncbi:FAD:protein FMN transferase [Marilutibacter chinensis]|uniref:FAD:protein FMN transferase n=1 Tax=Marilutibacter chinensis TaxID=2912247 RepID=A0ABS9HWL6_9GAMM|nr:FAD:protein FMN transferase [Lysobacter chinensis]MCF7222442.1 FAD:protein FMN transferase [Lysobacter chinensis]
MRPFSLQLAGFLLTGILLVPQAALAATLHHLSGRTMGTTWQVRVASDADPDRLSAGIQAQLDEVVAQMSTWEPASDISRFNRAPAGELQGLPDAFFEVLDAALTLAADTGGAYDPTVGPLVNLWGFGPDGARDAPPDDRAIAAVMARSGWRRLVLDRRTRTVVQPGGLYLDLSSIAKGYGVDRVAAYLDATGSSAWLVEVGGELRARGRKPDGETWRIAIEQPAPDDRGDGAATGDLPQLSGVVLEPGDMAVATSGDYRHYFETADGRFSHTIDPRNGRPVSHGLASVTVLHPSCMQADALATALSVLGPEAGYRYAVERGLAALFFVHAGDGFQRRTTPAFERHLLP